MTKTFRHIAAMLCVALAALLTACGSDSYDVPENPAEESAGMFLVCNVGLVGGTRTDNAPAIESMQSLRIVVLNDKGAVESNDFFEFQSLRDTYYHIIPLKSRGMKRIFIFSNEESVESMRCEPASLGIGGSLHEFLESVAEGAADFETKINSIYYQPDFTRAIPMNAVYDVEVPAGEKYISKTFWLVRVATKFSFTFVNNRYHDVTVEKFSVSGLSDRHFFMPKFTGGQTPTFAGYDTWIDWLKDVSDKSQNDPDNPTADVSGWLTGYDLPADAQSKLLSYSNPFTLNKVNEDGLYGGVKEIFNLYACESKNLRSDGKNVIDDEQQYTLRVECASNGEKKTFEVELPNVRSLFRNTHAHVYVNINEKFLVLTVDLQPFSCVTLRPDFGLERTEDGYIVVRDKNGRIVKYIRPDGTVLTFKEDNRWPYLGKFMGVFDDSKRVLVGYFIEGPRKGKSIIFNYASDVFNEDNIYENLQSWGVYSESDLKDKNGFEVPEHLEETFFFKDQLDDGVAGGVIKGAYTHSILDDKSRLIEEYRYPSLEDFWKHQTEEDHQNCGRIKLADYTGDRYGDKVITYYDDSGKVICRLTVKGDTETYVYY